MITIKKIIAIIPIAILFILLSSKQDVNAAAQYNNIQTFENIVVRGYGSNTFYIIYGSGYPFSSELYSGTRYIIKTFNTRQFGPYGTLQDALDYINSNPDVEVPENMANNNYYMDSLYIYKGSVSGDLPPGTVFPPEPPEPDTWYDILWRDFTHWIDEIGDSLSEGYDDFINWISGESTHGGGHEFRMPDVVRPSPIPTPIPYNTVIVPKTDPNTGNTYYEYNYVYNNPSGTPIITGSPPPNVDVTVNDNDFEYPYYNNPDNRNNPYYFEMPWYLKFINGTDVFDLDDMSDNLDVMETAINDETISDGVTSAYSSMATLPTNWIQLVGLIASIPLIGCLIARFLKG